MRNTLLLLSILATLGACTKGGEKPQTFKCNLTDSVGCNIPTLNGTTAGTGIVGAASSAGTAKLYDNTLSQANAVMANGYIPMDTIFHHHDTLILHYQKYTDCKAL